MNSPTKFSRFRDDNRIIFGYILAGIGIFSLLHLFNLIPSFHWIFNVSWPIVLIVIGLIIGIRRNFQSIGPWVMIGIGLVNLIPAFNIGHVHSSDLVFPIGIILIGGLIIVRGRKNKGIDNQFFTTPNSESTFLISIMFGGRKEIVTSQDFKGGTINATFGGAELNLMRAEIKDQSIVLNMNVLFGGIELLIPSNWVIKNEMGVTFGNVEDMRGIFTPIGIEEVKTVILRGSCTFGNVEIKSYK